MITSGASSIYAAFSDCIANSFTSLESPFRVAAKLHATTAAKSCAQCARAFERR